MTPNCQNIDEREMLIRRTLLLRDPLFYAVALSAALVGATSSATSSGSATKMPPPGPTAPGSPSPIRG